MQTISIKDRDFGADIIRIFALLMVFTVHVFLRDGFYFRHADGFWGFLAVSIRSFSMCCVPLFMILTGYLKCNKRWDTGYYRSLLPILASYIIISLIHLLYKLFVLRMTLTASEWLLQFMGFKLADYSWYVGMYIGLFLISPLLNLIWSGCSSRKMHAAVVLTMLSLTALPSMVNGFTNSGVNILPAYFTQIYYVTYYFLGCYFRTYRPGRLSGNRAICAVCAVSISVLNGIANVLTRQESDNFYSGYSAGYSELTVVLLSCSVFLALSGAKTERIRTKKLIAFISGISFEAYLLSYLFDSNIYPLITKAADRTLYFPVGMMMVSVVFIFSLAAAFPVNRLSRLLSGALLKKRAPAAAFSKCSRSSARPSCSRALSFPRHRSLR